MRSLQRFLVVWSIVAIAAMVGEVGDREALSAKPRFVDNGDGTITDSVTRLQWEKKDLSCPGVHCVTDVYTWSDAMLSFVSAVNDSSADGVTVTGLGGYTDWRLPDIAELQMIIDLSAAGCGSGSPCIDPIFGPTATDAFYWSSSSNTANPTNAWLVRFDDGLVANGVKSFLRPVRAVRGGR
jgi:Protein of unknown function (DUF1566)